MQRNTFLSSGLFGFLCVFLFILTQSLFAQSPSIADLEPEEDAEEYEITLQENQFSKIQLNLIDETDSPIYELADSSFWNVIILHREKWGYFFSEYEIQTIPNLDSQTVIRILPFLSAEKIPGSWKKGIIDTDVEYIMLRQTQELQNRSTSLRYKRTLRNISFMNLSANYFQYKWKVRGSAWYKPNSHFTLLAGHYKLDWGLGLLLGSFAPGKMADPIISAFHPSKNEIPWNSNGFHWRGGGIKIQPTQRSIVGFWFSNQLNPASVKNNQIQYWHWSPLKNSKHIMENNVALSLQYRFDKSELGILTWFNYTEISTKFYSTNTPWAYSFYLRKKINQSSWNSELAINDKKIAYTSTLYSYLGKNTDLICNVRKINLGYFSKYMNSFSLNYQNPAMIGMYIGLRKSISRKMILSGYGEGVRYWNEGKLESKNVKEAALMTLVKIQKGHQVQVKIRAKHHELTDSIYTIWYLQLSEGIEAKPFKLKYRLQGSILERQYGCIAGGEVEYKKNEISVLVGVSFYSIQHYSLKQSWYERPIYLNNGFTWYFHDGNSRYGMIQWNISSKLKAWFRVYYSESKSTTWKCEGQFMYWISKS